jgi:predicted esterase
MTKANYEFRPIQPVSVNGGMKMPSWYDIFGFDKLTKMDKEGIERTRDQLTDLIDQEHKEGIPYHRIVVGGFSQGSSSAVCRRCADLLLGCVSTLFTGLTSKNRLGGIMGLSGYIALAAELPSVNFVLFLPRFDLFIFAHHPSLAHTNQQ